MGETDNQTPSIVLEGISKRYGRFLALDNVSFQVNRGEVFGYIGPNGAGKTTTIKLIVGLLSDFEGSLRIEGHIMPKERSEVHKVLGYLPQNVAFQEWRTVDHALRTFGKLSGLSESELNERIEEVLDLVGLSNDRHKKISQLSGGMTQKVGLAQALIHRPRLLVLDEPLGGLDPASRYQIKQTIVKLAKAGATVFFSSHILSDVQDIANKIGILNKGHIMRVGTLEELKSQFSIDNNVEITLSYDSGRWKKLESIKGVKSIEQQAPNKLVVHLEDQINVDDTLQELIKQLIAFGCKIRSFNPVSPTLDEMYLKYVQERGNA
ncbi:MAG: ABC transporter ATP-binding protein [Candidatus Bathyarchaeia archaeon]